MSGTLTGLVDIEDTPRGVKKNPQSKPIIYMGSKILKEQIEYEPIIDHWLSYDCIS